MRITYEALQTVHETKDIVCNQCGSSCYSTPEYVGLIEAQVCTGYGSKFLGDGNNFSFSLCEECLVKLFKTFKHPALTENIWGISLDSLWQRVIE
jgi:hypothetical protein